VLFELHVDSLKWMLTLLDEVVFVTPFIQCAGTCGDSSFPYISDSALRSNSGELDMQCVVLETRGVSLA